MATLLALVSQARACQVRSAVASVSSRKRSASGRACVRAPFASHSSVSASSSIMRQYQSWITGRRSISLRAANRCSDAVSYLPRVTEAPSCRSPGPPGNPSIRVVRPPVDQDREARDDVLVGGAGLGGAPLDEVEVDQMRGDQEAVDDQQEAFRGHGSRDTIAWHDARAGGEAE